MYKRQVQERIPDYVFDRANQVELVDLEPDELVKRLQAGKVYGERQAKRALQNFFTTENLAALREIAMRRTADQLNRFAVQEGNPKSARAGEHILICLSSAPSNAKVIRTAARMADAFHSGFTALFVQMCIRDSHKDELRHHIDRALDEGATWQEIVEVIQIVSTLGIHAITMGVPILKEAIQEVSGEQK